MKSTFGHVEKVDDDYPFGLRVETPYSFHEFEAYDKWVDYIKTESYKREQLSAKLFGYNCVSGHYDIIFHWFKTNSDRVQFKLMI